MEPAFLIVEDDAVFARSVRRTLAPYGTTFIADSLQQARALMPQQRWCAIIADLNLDDGLGFEAIEAARARDATVPAMVLTGHADAAFINRAYALDAQYLCKDCEPADILRFAVRAIAREAAADRDTQAFLEEMSRTHDLGPRLTQTLFDVIRLGTRMQIAKARAVSVNTVKSDLRLLLRKVGFKSCKDLRLHVLTRGAAKVPDDADDE